MPNEDFIALIDSYDPNICDDFLNAAKGCICKHDDKSSRFFSKISALKIPTICHFDDKLYNYLTRQNGNDITILYTIFQKSQYTKYTKFQCMNCAYLHWIIVSL